jgi:putative methionine-R-sulfoxide reductase with GAF domain
LAGGAFILLTILLIKRREKNIKAAEDKKLQIQKLKADQFRSRMELEQIINFFSFSLVDKNSVDDVVWDVATNLIGKLGFIDCIIYLWNKEKTMMVQKAGFGGKDSPEKIKKMVLEVLPGQGIVGHVMQTKEPLIIEDTSLDNRYRADDEIRASEITVPILHNEELIGVLDSEHTEKNFFTEQHLQILVTVATLMSNKIAAIEAEESLQKQKSELHYINEQLYKTKLEALRSQMNPHFIFNSLNAIQECILTGKVDAAYQYLSKFSKLQRMVLNNSEKELIPLKKEIEMLELYLELESLRFSKSFSYSIKVNEINPEEELMVPSMITQPFVENAIWHGLRNKTEEQILQISYTEAGNKLLIMVSDNGVGREAAEKIKKEKLGMDQHESRGSILMQNRLSILERQLNIQINLEIIDEHNKDGKPTGTTVHITCPSNL